MARFLWWFFAAWLGVSLFVLGALWVTVGCTWLEDWIVLPIVVMCAFPAIMIASDQTSPPRGGGGGMW